MKHRILNDLQNFKAFWKAGLFYQRRISFPIFSFTYSQKYKFREGTISFRILIATLGGFFRLLLIALVFIVSVDILTRITNLGELSLDEDALSQLLNTLVTTIGVLLGLYFAALSAVAGSLFMKAPKKLQDLFRRDRKGNQYIKTLVLVTIIGLIYMLLMAYDYNIGSIGPILITALALYATARMLAIGPLTFYFIHPGEAGSTLSGDAAKAIDNASYGGFGAKKDYLQKHYQKQAKESLDTYHELIGFGIDQLGLSPESHLEIAGSITGLLRYYLRHRKEIPSDSLWYAKKYKHKNWLLTQESALTMALNTGTSLLPDEINDEEWFEAQATDLILRIFEHLASRGEWGYAQSCMEMLVNTVEKCGSNLYKNSSSIIVDKARESILKIIDDSPKTPDDQKGHLALVDSLGRLPIGSLVSLNRYLGDSAIDTIISDIDSVNFQSKKSVYANRLPGSMLPELETTHRQLSNEIQIEGRRISPGWYTQTITLQQYLRQLNAYYQKVKDYGDQYYKPIIQSFIDKNQYLEAATMTDRWVEFTNKLLSLGWRVQQIVEQSQPYRAVQDLPWTVIDDATEKSELQTLNRSAIDKLTSLITPLSLLPKDKIADLPDYFGQAYTFGLEAVYDAARENNHERLNELFGSVFIGALKAQSRIRDEVEGWAEQSQILLSSEPIEDVLTLSGYLKIYAELHENPLIWEIAQNAWNKYLDTLDAKAIITMMIAMSVYRDSQFGIITDKSVLRTHWEFGLRDKLEEKGLAQDAFSTPFEPDPAPAHPSPLIRICARRASMLGFDARAVFFVSYLSKHSAAADIEMEFPDIHEIKDQLEREEASRNENTGQEDEGDE